jgi:hypothetical protein
MKDKAGVSGSDDEPDTLTGSRDYRLLMFTAARLTV